MQSARGITPRRSDAPNYASKGRILNGVPGVTTGGETRQSSSEVALLGEAQPQRVARPKRRQEDYLRGALQKLEFS